MAHRDVNLKQAHTSDTFIESQSWNPELHTLGKINAGKFGKSANVYYRDITRFRLLLPVMSCPFGISLGSEFKANSKESYNISFSVTDPKLQQTFEGFDQKIIELVSTRINHKTNQYELVNCSVGSRDPIGDILQKYSPSLKKSAHYAPRITCSLKVASDTQELETIILDHNGNELDDISLTDPSSDSYIKKLLPSHSTASAIIEPNLWSLNGSVGIKWRIVQLTVSSSPQADPTQGVCMLGDD